MEGGENNQLLSLLKDMISDRPETVRKSTEKLTNGFNDAASVVQLCTVLSSSKNQSELRKCSGMILKKHLSEREAWNHLSSDNKAKIQSDLLSAFKAIRPDDNELLESIIIRNLGYVMDYVRVEEGKTNEWNDSIFKYIEELCKAQNKNAQALGPYLFRLLVKTSPKMVQNYLSWSFRIFMSTVQMANAPENLSTLATDQLLGAWSLIIPLYSKRTHKQEDLATTLPHIMSMTRAAAYQPEPMSTCQLFDVLIKLNKYTPKLILPHLKLVMDELYALVNDTSLSEKTRAQAMTAIRSCVSSMRPDFIRLKMMDKLLMTLHSLLAVPPDSFDNDDPLSLAGQAGQTVLYVAQNSDTLRVAKRSLRLMEPELEQQDSARRRLAALVFLTLMAKGFTDLLSGTLLERFVNAVEKGMRDCEVQVQGAAYVALATMAENLQPELTRLAHRVLPSFNSYLDSITEKQRLFAKDTEPTYSQMFCSLEIYCESLKAEVLQPHLEELMKRLLRMAQPNSLAQPVMRQLSLSNIACLAKISKDKFSPHFDEVMDITLPMIKQTPDEDVLLQTNYAIQVGYQHIISLFSFAFCPLRNFLPFV